MKDEPRPSCKGGVIRRKGGVKTKAKVIEECATLFEIEVPKESVEAAFEEVYNEIAKVSNIPGFRPGKAPRELVKKHYENNAKEEVLKRLIPDAYRNALAEHQINPIGMPEIQEVNFKEGSRLSFKAKIETHPKFKLKNYKGIRLEKKKLVLKDEDVNKTLDNLRELNAKYIAVEDRPVQLGDYVVSDMECFVDGKSIHKKRENLWLSVDKESFIPGLADKMVGMKKGEERDIEAALPEKYPDKLAAGKPARYRIMAKEIKYRKLPNLDDEFAKDLGKDTLEDLKKDLSEELKRRAKLNIEADMENQVLNRLTDENKFGVPPSLARRQLDFMVEDAKRRLQEKGFKKVDLDKKDDEFKNKFKDDAVRQVRLMFILDSIARDEDIKVSADDVEEAYKSISNETGQALEKVKDYYKKEGLADSLKEKIKEEKTIKSLLDNAQVIEV